MNIKQLFSKTLLVLMFSCLFISTAYSKEVYTFGVVPQSGTLKVAKLWSPLLRHIKKTSGVKVKFATANTMEAFEERLANGDFDFVYMDPQQYVDFSKSGQYLAIAKRKEQPLKGIIVVHKDSPIQSLADLNNSKMAFPSPTEFGSTLVPQKALVSENISMKPHYVNSDDSVYLSVSKGLFQAGGGIKVTFDAMKKKVKKKLRVIWEAPDYTPHAIAVHERVPADIVLAVQQSFLTLSDDKNCSVQLKKLKIMQGLELAKDEDWNDIRQFKSASL